MLFHLEVMVHRAFHTTVWVVLPIYKDLEEGDQGKAT